MLNRLIHSAGPAALLALALPLGSAAAQAAPQEGFTVIPPLGNTSIYMIDNAGVTAHTWPSTYLTGKSIDLLPNNNLIRTIADAGTGTATFGGFGGGIQELDWDGNVLWEYKLNNATYLLHHDFALMPNGNIIMVAWETKTQAEAIAAGRDPAITTGALFYPEYVVELQRDAVGATIVWDWHIWDHMVQEFDPLQANFGVVADNPQLSDINYPASDIANGDWLHCNSIDYNPQLDQVLMSMRGGPVLNNEIWVIDQSTTSAEAAGHTGGNQGKGGDLLWRWGNPEAYQAGTAVDMQLHGEHDANWVPEGLPGAGNITIFNNGRNRPAGAYSSIVELTPPNDAGGAYPAIAPGTPHGPAAPVWEYVAATPTDFYSSFVSGAIRLPNGNTLVTSGAQGWLFEVDPLMNVVWEHYFTEATGGTDLMFKARRFQKYIFPETHTISAATGGSVNINLEASSDNLGEGFLLLGSLSGTTPGTLLSSGITVPLNYDALSSVILLNLNTPTFLNFNGTLDGTGAAYSQLNLAPLPPSFVGLTADFAFVTTTLFDWTSDAQGITFVP